VRVVEVNVALKRVSLSMKSEEAQGKSHAAKRPNGTTKKIAPASMDDHLAKLKEKFGKG
jgi:hypothetical protein